MLDVYSVNLFVMKKNAACVSILKKLKSTKELNVYKVPEVFKGKSMEVEYRVMMNKVFLNRQGALSITPPVVCDPIVRIVMDELSKKYQTIVQHWLPCHPEIGLTPIVLLGWNESYCAFFIKK